MVREKNLTLINNNNNKKSMKKQLLMKTFLVAVCLLGGANFAWANTQIGATGTGWDDDGSCTSAYTLEADKTLTFEFTVDATRKEYIADGWVTILCSTTTRNDWANHYVFMRDDCYGVNKGDWTNKTTAQSGWFITNENNYNWTDFQNNIIDGATVVQTIRRYGTEAFIITDVTTKTSAKYRHYFVMDLGTKDDIYAFIGADFAQLTITSDTKTDSPAPTLTGTLVGKLNKTGRLASHGDIVNFTLAPESSMSLTFKLYSTKLHDWAQWLYEIQQDDKLYTLSVGNKNSWNDLKEAESIETENWPSTTAELLEKMDGATVTMTVTRTGAKVEMKAVHTPVIGDPFTITASVTPTKDGFATSDITVRPLVELGYLDLLPVTAPISSYGWATFSSDYALDFSKATTGLEAYMITGHEGSVVTKSKVTGTVPAGTGLLLKGAEGSYTIPIVGSSSTDVSANKLVAGTGASVSKEDDKTKYVLGVSASSEAEFQKIDGTAATVAKGKAYLQFDEVISARSMSFEGDEITGIENVAAPAEATLKEGKFIENGQLVIVKNGVKFNAAGQQMK